MNRRALLLAGAAALASPSLAETPASAAADLVRIGSVPTEVPADFVGLSYETPQLLNPAYFCADNGPLVAAFRLLGLRGVLRFGGSLSAFTRWRSDRGDFSTPREARAIAVQTNWEWRLTDPSLKGPGERWLTPDSLRALRGFLDATGWTCIYGLNLATGAAERAADEADHAMRLLGDRLTCFQLGNEPDFFGGNPLFRPAGYDFEQYWSEFRHYVEAVRRLQPAARFAGPDVAVNLDWVKEFARRSGDDAVFLSAHHYAMGPASDPAMTAERLLAPRNETLERQIDTANTIRGATGLRFRMTEGNSCFGGGKAGVSDAYASALWAADYMLRVASAGYLGVNLHGGGDGLYTPIAATEAGPALRPVFQGMRWAAAFAGSRLERLMVLGDENLSAYLGRKDGERLLAVINKTAARRDLAARPPIAIPGSGVRIDRLSGPSLGADHADITQEEARADSFAAEPYSATLFRWADRG